MCICMYVCMSDGSSSGLIRLLTCKLQELFLVKKQLENMEMWNGNGIKNGNGNNLVDVWQIGASLIAILLPRVSDKPELTPY